MPLTKQQSYGERPMIKVLLANPRGFCAGVDRAIEIVERALSMHGAPIYVRHEVVHNRFVVENLEKKGAVFVENLDEVPVGSILIFSAHGVSHEVRREGAALPTMTPLARWSPRFTTRGGVTLPGAACWSSSVMPGTPK